MALRELLADFRVKVSGLGNLLKANKALDQTAALARSADARFSSLRGTATQLSGGLANTGAAASGAAKGLDLFSFQAAAVAFAAHRAVRAIVNLSDEYTTLQNRLNFVTDSREEAVAVEEKLFAISQKNFQAIGDTAELFQRYKIATDDLGLSQDEVLDFTDRLQRATVLTAGSAAEAQGALVQLAQGIGTNFEAAGQELRSIQEQAPVLAGIIAKAAGGNASQLLKLAKEGKINAELVVQAVRDAGTELDKAFIGRTPKFSDGLTIMGNALVRFTGRLQNASGASETFGGITEGFIDVLGAIEKPLTTLLEKVDLLRFALVLAGVALAPFVAGWAAAAASAVVAVAPFVALALVLDEIVATFMGGDTIIRRFFDGLFGEGETAKSIENIKLGFSALWDIIVGLFRFLTGDLSLDGFVQIFGRAADDIGDVFDNAIDSMIARIGTLGDVFSGVWGRIKVLASEAFDFMKAGAVDLIKDLPGGETILRGLNAAGNLASEGIDAARNLVASSGGLGVIPQPAVAGASNTSNTTNNTNVGARSVTVNVQSNQPQQIAGAVDRALESDRNAILARIP